MFSYLPSPHPRILFVTDTRSLNDANLDRRRGYQQPGKQSVLANWWLGRDCFGSDWSEVGRIALFDFQQEVSANDRRKALTDLKTFLETCQAETIVCLQSLSKGAKKLYDDTLDSSSEHSGTACWQVFDGPGSIKDVAGTFYDSGYGRVLPLFNPGNVDYVFLDPMRTWLGWARDGTATVRPDTAKVFSEPGEGQRQALKVLLERARKGLPITFDLETYSTEDLITCIGLSDGEWTVSVPWHGFIPHGASYTEEGLEHAPEGESVRAIFKAAKVVIGHNCISHDIPFLKRQKIKVPGRVFDTYLAHGVSTKQLKHGLQAVTSYLFPIPPWKASHIQHAKASGLDPSYDARAWVQDPKELRSYNSLDVFYNALIAEPLASRCGILIGDF